MWASQLIGPFCLELRERLSCVKSSTSWLVIKQAVCFSSAMARRHSSVFVAMRALPLIEFMTSSPGALSASIRKRRASSSAFMASNGRLAVRSWFNRIVFDGGMLTVAS